MTRDPRNGAEILDDEQCWERLRSEEVGRLAVAVAGKPDIFPINYTVSDGAIFMRSAEGSKLVSVVINEWVAFEVDGYVPDDNHAWSVVVHGKAELVGNQEIDDYVAGLPLFPWNTSPKNRFIKIEVTDLSGRSFIAEGHNHP
jgi:uncharacterized protein